MKLPTALRSLALLLATTLPVYGTLVVQLSFDELVQQSEVVAHGRVVSSRVAWDADRSSLWTHYEIQIEESLKGELESLVSIQEPGGELDGVVSDVAGTPRYAVGEEVVVFAARAGAVLRTCGWGQGRYVVTRSATGTAAVARDLRGIQLVTSRRSSRQCPERRRGIP